MSASTETRALMADLGRRDISLSFADTNTLRRAQLTLRRWFELECGDGDQYKSWAIERDDNGDGPPFMCIYPHDGKARRYRIPDREAGARRRIAEVCERNGLHYCIQGDPRGPSLYVAREPFPDFDQSRGVACAV